MINGREEDDTGLNSNCTNINYIKVSSHNLKIPKLLVLINSFTHMSTSLCCLKNFKMTGQFWSVFSHFSELGDTARLYLL